MDLQERDQDGQLLAYIFVDGTFVNLELRKSGHAVLLTIPPNVKHIEEFRQAQLEAREKGVGIWSLVGGLAESPKEFRQRAKAGRRGS